MRTDRGSGHLMLRGRVSSYLEKGVSAYLSRGVCPDTPLRQTPPQVDTSRPRRHLSPQADTPLGRQPPLYITPFIPSRVLYHTPLLSPPVDRQTWVKTVPSPILRMRSVNILILSSLKKIKQSKDSNLGPSAHETDVLPLYYSAYSLQEQNII